MSTSLGLLAWLGWAAPPAVLPVLHPRAPSLPLPSALVGAASPKEGLHRCHSGQLCQHHRGRRCGLLVGHVMASMGRWTRIGSQRLPTLADLGVDQQVGRRRAGTLVAGRMAACVERFRRCALLTTGYGRRLRVLSTSGYPVALFGMAPSVWPRSAVVLARRQGLASWPPCGGGGESLPPPPRQGSCMGGLVAVCGSASRSPRRRGSIAWQMALYGPQPRVLARVAVASSTRWRCSQSASRIDSSVVLRRRRLGGHQRLSRSGVWRASSGDVCRRGVGSFRVQVESKKEQLAPSQKLACAAEWGEDTSQGALAIALATFRHSCHL